jgi:uncharacterized protein (TIGR02300 family)
MATKAERGTKRTCQDASCAARFYDLARNPITCPVCGAAYEIVVRAPAVPRQSARHTPSIAPVVPEQEAEVASVDLEEADEAVAPADEETLLEEVEEGDDDMSGIVGEPGKEEP